ncbi:MAG: hypothetical protein GY811_06020 [Myxococcales bacterium]|nr:hypothetical protein [Myxococcales bacterium]
MKNNWTSKLTKAQLRTHREKQVRNLHKAIEGTNKRFAELCAECPDFKDEWGDLWNNEIAGLERQLKERLAQWKRGE